MNARLSAFFVRKAHTLDFTSVFRHTMSHGRALPSGRCARSLARPRRDHGAHPRPRAVGASVPRAPGAIFHAVTAGAVLGADAWSGAARIDVRRRRAASDGSPACDRERSRPDQRDRGTARKGAGVNAAGEIVLDGPGDRPHIICAAYDYDREVAHPLLSLLPSMLLVSGQEMSEGNAVQTLSPAAS